MYLMLICCGLTSVGCNQGTNEPHMARMLDVAEKCPSNDTNDFDGRNDAQVNSFVGEFIYRA
jgi:hypothetical protein